MKPRSLPLQRCLTLIQSDALRETREALTQRDAPLASSRAEALKQVLQQAGTAIYAQAAQPGPQPPPGTGATSGKA
jgi:hypothetical protein